MKRILHVASGDFFSSYGGGQVYVKNIVDEQIRQGIDIVILSFVNKSFAVVERSSDGVLLWEVGTLATIDEITKLIISVQPSLIHTHGHEFELCSLGKQLHIPVVITAHHGGILCPAGTLMNAEDEICQSSLSHRNCLKCCLANIRTGRAWYPFMRLLPEGMYRCMGRKLAQLPFVPFISPIGGVAKSIEDKIAEWKSICNNATMIVAPSHAIAEAMCRNGLDVSKVRVIPHGIPGKTMSVEQLAVKGEIRKEKLEIRKEKGIDPSVLRTPAPNLGEEFSKQRTVNGERLTVCENSKHEQRDSLNTKHYTLNQSISDSLNTKHYTLNKSGSVMRFFFLGRICRVKGLHVLLEAFDDRRFAEKTELHIIGGAGNKGEQRYMQSLQRKYQRDNIVWHGKVPSEKVLETIQDFDVMVHPTICLEIFGLNISESLLMHKPVLATRCGGAEMQIRDGENGWLVEPNSAVALRERMLQIVDDGIPFSLDAIDSGVISIEQHVKDWISLYEEKACIDRC